VGRTSRGGMEGSELSMLYLIVEWVDCVENEITKNNLSFGYDNTINSMTVYTYLPYRWMSNHLKSERKSIACSS